MIMRVAKFLRHIRVENNERLIDMAEKLNISTSYLSAIENEKRTAPLNFARKIGEVYELEESEVNELNSLIDETIKVISMKIDKYDKDSDLIISFARKFETLTETEKDKLRKMLSN